MKLGKNFGFLLCDIGRTRLRRRWRRRYERKPWWKLDSLAQAETQVNRLHGMNRESYREIF